MDYDFLSNLRRNHPAWRLLAADGAPFVVAFLYRTFVDPNVRALGEKALTAKLEDYLYYLRQSVGDQAFPRSARDYLRDWADDARGWLRRYYPLGSDEPHFDLTSAAERAIQWLAALEERRFVGAESRLKLVFDLLQQIAMGSETNPDVRIAELRRRRADIDAEIERIRGGALPLLEPTQLRERFVQATDTARALLADFRQVEQNFRDLDRQVRERITTAEGSKGELLEEIFGERDAIVDSDQGRSFRAFWDFLMSPARQEELTGLLEQVLALEQVAELAPGLGQRLGHTWNAIWCERIVVAFRQALDEPAWQLLIGRDARQDDARRERDAQEVADLHAVEQLEVDLLALELRERHILDDAVGQPALAPITERERERLALIGARPKLRLQVDLMRAEVRAHAKIPPLADDLRQAHARHQLRADARLKERGHQHRVEPSAKGLLGDGLIAVLVELLLGGHGGVDHTSQHVGVHRPLIVHHHLHLAGLISARVGHVGEGA